MLTEWVGSGEQRGLQQALPLTDLLEQETLGTVLRVPPKEEELAQGCGHYLRAHPGALTQEPSVPKHTTHHSGP